MPCHTIPAKYYVMPYPCHAIPYHTRTCRTVPYHTMPYHATPCHVLPYHVMHRTSPQTIPILAPISPRGNGDTEVMYVGKYRDRWYVTIHVWQGTPKPETDCWEVNVRERESTSNTDYNDLAAVRCNRTPKPETDCWEAGRAGASKIIQKNPTQTTIKLAVIWCRGSRNEKQIAGWRSCGGDRKRGALL